MNVCDVCEFGPNIKPKRFGCVTMGSAVLYILRSRLLLYTAWSVVLSGFSMRYLVLCFVQEKSLCRYGCMYFMYALVLVCVDLMVISTV